MVIICIYIYIWSRVPCSHPPHGMGGVWCPCGGVYTYIHTYLHTYLPTYLPTYIHTHIHTHRHTYLPTYIHTYIHAYTQTYIPTYLPTYLHTYLPTYVPTYLRTYVPTYRLRTYVHTYLPTYLPTYIHTYIPTYQHTNIPPPQATGGGGPEEPDDTVHPYPLVGREGGWPTLHHIYIYIYICVDIFELTLIVGSAGPLGPPFHRSVGVKVTEWGPASEIYSLGFLEHICWNRRFFGEQVSSRKLLRRVFPKELLPISTCYFV